MKREQIINVEVLTLSKKIASQIQLSQTGDVFKSDIEEGKIEFLGWTHVDAVFPLARLGVAYLILFKIRGRVLWHSAWKDDRHECWGIEGKEQLFIK